MTDIKTLLCKKYPFMKKKGVTLTSFSKREILEKYRDEKLLIMMIGVQGSGKTTYCRRNFSGYDVINLDEILAEYLRKNQVQFSMNVNEQVNLIFFERVEKVLKEKGVVIVDTGAVNFDVRIMILDYLQESYTKVILLVLNPPLEEIVEQIKGQIELRARPDLWSDVAEEYAMFQYQISKNFLPLGVDEVYMI